MLLTTNHLPCYLREVARCLRPYHCFCSAPSPAAQTNLAANSDYAATLAEMKALLDCHVAATATSSLIEVAQL